MGWTPGKKPRPSPEGTAWELRPKNDIVLQLHMTRTGKKELVAPRIGLHFGDGPPDRPLHSTLLFSEAIDIPAGRSEHVITDQYTVPIDVDLLAVYPHAHYLGKQVLLTAETPDGGSEELLRIDDWDFDWQDEYHYLEPVRLKAGTVLEMRWTFDNSAANIQNPNSPPRRVRYGLESSDEMATMSLMLFPKTEREMFELRASSAEHTISKRPSDGPANNALGVTLIDLERYDEAVLALEKATALSPRSSDSWTNLGIAQIHQKRSDLAVDSLTRALEIDDANERAHQHMGRAYIALERPRRALNHYKDALAKHPNMVEVRMDWANLLASTGRTGTAIRQYEAVLKAMPRSADVYNNLGNAMASAGRRKEAVEKYERALELDAEHFDARANLGRVLVALGRSKEALPHIEKALRMRPGDPVTKKLLQRAKSE